MLFKADFRARDHYIVDLNSNKMDSLFRVLNFYKYGVLFSNVVSFGLGTNRIQSSTGDIAYQRKSNSYYLVVRHKLQLKYTVECGCSYCFLVLPAIYTALGYGEILNQGY